MRFLQIDQVNHNLAGLELSGQHFLLHRAAGDDDDLGASYGFRKIRREQGADVGNDLLDELPIRPGIAPERDL